ncbi:MAG: hypothetical protein KC656_33165, partial [Myxococcales bacterium]|nr:hypothetical protein [Myxococcales bacterium]
LGEVHVGRQILPHAWYTADVVPIGFWRMPAGFEPVRDLPKALIGEVPVRTRPPPPPPMPERPPPGPDQNPPWW